jgi:hypothetical protein
LVEYSEVAKQDVLDWWDVLDHEGMSGSIDVSTNSRSDCTAWGRGNTVFLFGHYSDHGPDDTKEGSAGKVRGRTNIQGPETRVVFPLVHSRDEKNNVDKSPLINNASNEYARINGSNVSPSNIRQVHVQDEKYAYDGSWLCVRGLSCGDRIEFGGEGDLGYKTDAEWEIV